MAKHKKEATSQIKKEETKTLRFIVGGVVILAIALLALLFYQSRPQAANTQGPQGDTVVGKVNDQTILQSQLDLQYSKLPAQFRQVLTKGQVLDQMIDEALLLQQAQKLGIQVSDEDVQKKLGEFLQQSNIDQKVFEESLKRQGISQDEINTLFRKQITLQTLLEQKFGKDITVSDKDILDYFNKNVQDYKIPPSTKVRHILIALGNMTDAEAQQKAQEVRDKIKPDFSNFCELAQDYSADRASVKTCGEYTYSADTGLVPEFKEAGDKQGINQISIVKTQYGYHIIQTLAKLPERLPKFQDVRDDIAALLKAQKQRNVLRQYVTKLRKQAHIENLLTNQTTEPVAVDAAPPVETTEAKPTAPVQPTERDLNAFALCLSKKTTLYGAKTDLETKKQLNAFGNAAQYLNYVECSYLGNPNVIRKECSQKGVEKFPTWIINGIKEEGTQSMDKLADAAGC